MSKSYDVIVIGGGAAGFFAAISAKINNPSASVIILEKHMALLSKVRVSGGGRCNVTHACFDPHLLAQNYPRGGKELIGPFFQFQPKDTVSWFESRGVILKTESDGRMFPVSDSSESIINCLMDQTKKLGIEIFLKQKIEKISKVDSGFSIEIKEDQPYIAKNLILATGSSTDGHEWAKELGHTIIPAVPSLFTFNVPNSYLKEQSGISFKNVTVRILKSSFVQTGALLITHFGFSGPAVLKLSAWAARHLHEKNYSFEIQINWLGTMTAQEVAQKLTQAKKEHPQKMLSSENLFLLPKNFFKEMLVSLQLEQKRLNDLTNKEINLLSEKLCSDTFQVSGKTTHKEEFVTCGGICLKEVNFKTMESKVCPNLYFAGEVLDIDGVTGGFNFQNAWTTGYIAGSSI